MCPVYFVNDVSGRTHLRAAFVLAEFLMAVEKGAGMLDLIFTPALIKADLIVVFGFPVCYAISDIDRPLVQSSLKIQLAQILNFFQNLARVGELSPLLTTKFWDLP